jgi:hypothetical protein
VKNSNPPAEPPRTIRPAPRGEDRAAGVGRFVGETARRAKAGQPTFRLFDFPPYFLPFVETSYRSSKAFRCGELRRED